MKVYVKKDNRKCNPACTIGWLYWVIGIGALIVTIYKDKINPVDRDCMMRNICNYNSSNEPEETKWNATFCYSNFTN